MSSTPADRTNRSTDGALPLVGILAGGAGAGCAMREPSGRVARAIRGHKKSPGKGQGLKFGEERAPCAETIKAGSRAGPLVLI